MWSRWFCHFNSNYNYTIFVDLRNKICVFRHIPHTHNYKFWFFAWIFSSRLNNKIKKSSRRKKKWIFDWLESFLFYFLHAIQPKTFHTKDNERKKKNSEWKGEANFMRVLKIARVSLLFGWRQCLFKRGTFYSTVILSATKVHKTTGKLPIFVRTEFENSLVHTRVQSNLNSYRCVCWAGWKLNSESLCLSRSVAFASWFIRCRCYLMASCHFVCI